MFSVVLALALAASPQAQEVNPQAPEAAEEASKEEAKNERICRYIRPDMSSRRKERVCMTNDEWREFNRGN